MVLIASIHEGMARLSWAGWLLHTEIDVPHRELNPDTVTHLSTDRGRRRWTSLIETNALPPRQAITKQWLNKLLEFSVPLDTEHSILDRRLTDRTLAWYLTLSLIYVTHISHVLKQPCQKYSVECLQTSVDFWKMLQNSTEQLQFYWMVYRILP